MKLFYTICFGIFLFAMIMTLSSFIWIILDKESIGAIWTFIFSLATMGGIGFQAITRIIINEK